MSDTPQVRRLADWDAEHLRSLAVEYETPLYVYDLTRIRENARRLRRAFPDADIAYAVKANCTRPVLETLADEGVGAECASAGELQRAVDAGFPSRTIRYTAVNPPARDLERVVDLGERQDFVVTIGAMDTLNRLEELGYDGRLCLRVNPGVGAGHHEKVATGAEPKFGIPYDRAARAVSTAAEHYPVVGIHAHVGSGLSDTDFSSHRELCRRMGDLARSVDVDLGFVAVGGGFGVPEREDEQPLDVSAVAQATREALGDVDAQLAIEPGRYFVADAGVLLTTVNTVKRTPETIVVGVDAGMTDLVRPAMYDAYHPVRNIAPEAEIRERATRPVEVAGPVCETADVFARDRQLPVPRQEEVLAIGNAGAYGYEMASQYNSRPRPAVVVVGDGATAPDTSPPDRNGKSGARLAVRRETIADITRLEQSW